MVFNYQMVSKMRLGANPPSRVPRVILPQPPLATPSESNYQCAYTRMWLCSYLTKPLPSVLTLSLFIYQRRYPVDLLRLDAFQGRWEKNETDGTSPSRAIAISQPRRPVDPSRWRPPGCSNIFHGESRFFRGCLPCVNPVIVSNQLSPEPLLFRMTLYVPEWFQTHMRKINQWISKITR